ncbi:MAG: PP2C family serine/threonine-protein phosphatase [Kofleriaceae bacterium]
MTSDDGAPRPARDSQSRPPRESIEVIVAGASDVGQIREHNEDHLLVGDLDEMVTRDVATQWSATGRRGPLLVVCDGMGGSSGGEVASELAAQVLWRELMKTDEPRDAEVFARLLRRAVRIANHDVHAMAEREPGLRGMGTTLSAAGFVGGRMVVATIGDSRAYVLRSGELVQVTRDQSLQSALLEAGHSARTIESAGGAILQALGVDKDVEPSLSVIDLRLGDRVLLCSDGLHGLVADPAIALLLSTPRTVQDAVRLLITAARNAGGTDNITALVCEVSGAGLQAPAGPDDLPMFREFDPQKEGELAFTPTSNVANRLAARIGLPTTTIPPSLPVTGQHAIVRSSIGIHVPPVEVEFERPGPARERLRGPVRWWWYVGVAVLACAIAWWLGGR